MNARRSRPAGRSHGVGAGGTPAGNRLALLVVLALVVIGVVLFLVAVRGR